MASATASLPAFNACPRALRLSGTSRPSSFMGPVQLPFFPRARTRSSSSAAKSAASSAVTSRSAFSLSRSSMNFLPAEDQAGAAGSTRSTRKRPVEGGTGVTGRGDGSLQDHRRRSGQRERSIACLSRLLQRGLSLLDQARESCRLMHRQIRQNLAVDLDAGLVDSVHELGVGQAMLTGGRIDSLDPECAKLALAHPAIAIGVLQRLFDPLDGDAVNVLATAAVSLGLLDDLLVGGMPGRATLDSCHVFSPPLKSAVR